ncbi:unnamed protein product [Gongylonema pulchrum]|uniref:Uncharacterized protein n=1 Tax=Gongylonema pulchrum TaxID=637853 RepID=A0A3P7N037_9BILA|nr:unnamed protein product [Gongylonema pulchrum]VDN35595.1 unnamed protein product [Gongylonema pulchrum]
MESSASTTILRTSYSSSKETSRSEYSFHTPVPESRNSSEIVSDVRSFSNSESGQFAKNGNLLDLDERQLMKEMAQQLRPLPQSSDQFIEKHQVTIVVILLMLISSTVLVLFLFLSSARERRVQRQIERAL